MRWSSQTQAALAGSAARRAAEGFTLPEAEMWGEDAAPDAFMDPSEVVLEPDSFLGNELHTNTQRAAKVAAPKVDRSKLRQIMQKQIDSLPITPRKVWGLPTVPHWHLLPPRFLPREREGLLAASATRRLGLDDSRSNLSGRLSAFGLRAF